VAVTKTNRNGNDIMRRTYHKEDETRSTEMDAYICLVNGSIALIT